MKKMLLAGAAIGALITGPVLAADLRAPVMKAPPPPPVVVYNWTGIYIGAHVGYGWGDKNWTRVDGDTPFFPEGSHEVDGFLAGGQLGINYQIGAWVLGIEGDISWTDLQGDHLHPQFAGTRLESEVNWLGTATARLGYAWDRWLFYGKGGVAFADDDHFVHDQFGALIDRHSASDIQVGWTVGAGLEWAFWGNWSAKLEYNYMDFGTNRLSFTRDRDGSCCSIEDIDQQIHVAKFGINYRFGPWSAPVAARY